MTEFTTWRSLVDGDEISDIPDSLELQLVAEDIDGSTGEWPARLGDSTLSEVGSPTVIDDDLNGEASVSYGGSDGHSDSSTTFGIDPPFGVIAVVQYRNTSPEDFGRYILDNNDGSRGATFGIGDGDPAPFFGNSDGEITSTNVPNENEWLIQSFVVNESNNDSEIRVNKSLDTSAAIDTQRAEGLRVGCADDETSNFLDGKITEIHVVSDLDDVTVSEDFVDSKYNVTG